ncbi:MAG: hypothetical protein IJ215_04480 [Clostridia bacterium]|nr:hypothetical protein [Clostridia bacterium]
MEGVDEKVNVCRKVAREISEILNKMGVYHETMKLGYHPEYYLVSNIKAATLASELLTRISVPVATVAIDEGEFLAEIQGMFYTFFVFKCVEEAHDYQMDVYHWHQSLVDVEE